MSEILTHAFVSTKSDSPDDTLVSASEWNGGHIFKGGINGQVLVYDNTQLNNIRWTDGPTLYSGTQSSGAVASPYTTPAIITVTANTPIVYQLNPDFFCVTSGAAAYQFSIKFNGIPVLNILSVASSTQFTYPFSGSLPAGTYAFTVTLTASAGTFTSTAVTFRVLTMGV